MSAVSEDVGRSGGIGRCDFEFVSQTERGGPVHTLYIRKCFTSLFTLVVTSPSYKVSYLAAAALRFVSCLDSRVSLCQRGVFESHDVIHALKHTFPSPAKGKAGMLMTDEAWSSAQHRLLRSTSRQTLARLGRPIRAVRHPAPLGRDTS